MNNGNLEFGWRTFSFAIKDACLSRKIELLEENEEGKWHKRNPLHFGKMLGNEDERKQEIKEFGEKKNLKYSEKLIREVSGNLITIDGGSMYLGEDLQEARENSKLEKIESVEIFITEVKSYRTLNDLMDYSVVAHFEDNDKIEPLGEGLYIQIYLPSDTFDILEDTTKTINKSIEISLNIKGWFRVWGWPHISEPYFERNKTNKVELVEFKSLQYLVKPTERNN